MALAKQTAPATFHLSVAGRTDVGRVRETNEDALIIADLTAGTSLVANTAAARFDVGERGILLAVSDGMGGAQAGEVASAIVIQTLARAMAQAPPGMPYDELMEDAIQRAHRAVWDASRERGQSGPTRMGATLTAMYVRGDEAYIGEVGDSRAYLIRGGTITQLTHDQSMVQVLIDTGAIEPDQVEESPFRAVILQAMGHQKQVNAAMAKLQLRERDAFVLCSDGLTRHLSDEDIASVVLSSLRPEIAADRLLDLANERGGEDNIAVIVAGASGSLAPFETSEPVAKTFEVIAPFEPSKPPT
jgi:PPM family protein phosphatase